MSTTKSVDIWFQGWTCSKCEVDNDEDASKCVCGKPYDKEADEWFDNEQTVELPAKWEICGDCNGEGKTYLGWSASDQPAFTAEDFDREGPDFYEDYMSGRYDGPCPACKGSGKVKVFDEKAIGVDKDLHAKYKKHIEAEESLAQMYAEMAAERRMGA